MLLCKSTSSNYILPETFLTDTENSVENESNNFSLTLKSENIERNSNFKLETSAHFIVEIFMFTDKIENCV